MFVCHYERKKFVDDHRQKYAEITKICLGNEIADKRLRFLQTKHLQCKKIGKYKIDDFFNPTLGGLIVVKIFVGGSEVGQPDKEISGSNFQLYICHNQSGKCGSKSQ